MLDVIRRDRQPVPGPLPALGNWITLLACGLLILGYARLVVVVYGHTATLRDFSLYWAAGRLALAGRAAAVYHWAELAQLKPFATSMTLFPYPPLFLIALAPVALLPAAAAAAAWFGVNLAAYLLGMRAIVPRGTMMLAALAAPVVLFNFTTGNSGLLLAGLLGAALAILDARPMASGVLIGLAVFKPQFGVLLPLFLAATGRWRVFASATLTVAVLAAITAAWFGWGVFVAFAQAAPTIAAGELSDLQLNQGFYWSDLESVYGMVRAAGASGAVAWAAHIGIAGAAVLAMLRIATGDAGAALSPAALATAMVVAAPFSEPNDMAILMVAWAFLIRDGLVGGFRWWVKLALSIVYLLPLLYLVGRVLARALGFPEFASWTGMGPIMCAILAALIANRFRQAAPWPRREAPLPAATDPL